MTQRRTIAAGLAALLLVPGAALAQDAGGCTKFKWSIDREVSAFGGQGFQAVGAGQTLPGIMDPAIVKLKPVAEAAFVRPPGHTPKSGTFGAVVTAPPIAVAGTYQVTLSDEAWIDVLQGGREIRSSGFSGQKDCPQVRKSVRFNLAQGPVTLQISGSAADSIKIDILPVQ